MPLVKQPVSILLGGGMNQGTDPKLVQPGSVLEVRNGVFDRVGEVVKRTGSTALPRTTTPGSGSLPVTPWKLATHRGALLYVPETGVYQFSAEADAWSRPADAVSTAALQCDIPAAMGVSMTALPPSFATPVVPPGGNCHSDIATSGNYAFVALVNAITSQATEMCVDLTTSKVMFSRTRSSVRRMRVSCADPSYAVFVCMLSDGRIEVEVFNVANLGVSNGLPARYPIGTSGSSPLDVATLRAGESLSIAYRNEAGQTTVTDFKPSAPLALVTTTYPAIDSSRTLAWLEDLGGSGLRLLGSAGTAAGVTVTPIKSDGTIVATYVVDGTATSNVQGIVGHSTGPDPLGAYQCFFERGEDGTEVNTRKIYFGERRADGSSSSGLWMSQVGLASKTWVHDGDYYAVLSFGSSADNPTAKPCSQQTNFVVRLSDANAMSAPKRIVPAARFATWRAAGWLTSASARPSVVSHGGDIITSCWVQSRLESSASRGQAIDLAPSLVTMTYCPAVGPAVEAADQTVIPSGVVHSFDGRTMAELGFHAYPHSLSGTFAAGGQIATGTYHYVAVYRYMGAQGRVWRSAPSWPLQVGVGADNSKVTLTCAAAKITSQESVTIEWYRTSAGPGSTYHLVGQVASDPLVDSVSLVDTASDATLAQGELLYATGGVIENDPPPPAVAATFWNSRLWLVSAERPSELWFSKALIPGRGFEFSVDQVIDAPGQEPITGIAGLDDKLIIFGRNQIMAIAGEGPDPALQSGLFSKPQITSVGVGCRDANTIAVTPEGVMFQGSDLGIYATNGFQTAFVGQAIQDVKQEVVSAVVLPDLQHVRFCAAQGTVLNYDYRHKQWSVFDAFPAIVSALSWNGGLTYVDDQGRVLRASGAYSEAGKSYALSVTFPWLSFGTIAGLERLYWMTGIGETAAPCTVLGDIWYDADPGLLPAESRSLALHVAGLGPVRWDWQWRPKRQRCSSAKIRISEQASFGAGFKITGLGLTVGLKPGSKRLPAEQRLA